MHEQDETFLVRDPNLHDARLFSLVLTDGGLQIDCESTTGQRFRLSLQDLVRVRADNFREGNIILEIRRYRGASCPAALIKTAFGAENDGSTDWLSGITDQIRRDDWTLVVLESSYGCELVALAKGQLRIDAYSD